MKQTWLRPLVWWIYSAIAVTGMCALVHLAVQQGMRHYADDPQVQLAEDGAARLAQDGVPADVVTRAQPLVDISTSLAPWVAVYDQQGMPLEASGQYDGAPPKLPQGVFDTSGWKDVVGHHLTSFYPKNENRFSWQPEPGVRQAMVLVQVQNGMYVAAGRSLRENDSRISQLTLEVGFVWAFTLASLFVAAFAASWVLKRS